jgi:hypothetical protein
MAVAKLQSSTHAIEHAAASTRTRAVRGLNSSCHHLNMKTPYKRTGRTFFLRRRCRPTLAILTACCSVQLEVVEDEPK